MPDGHREPTHFKDDKISITYKRSVGTPCQWQQKCMWRFFIFPPAPVSDISRIFPKNIFSWNVSTPECTHPNWILAWRSHPWPCRPLAGFGLVYLNLSSLLLALGTTSCINTTRTNSTTVYTIWGINVLQRKLNNIQHFFAATGIFDAPSKMPLV